jgi:hypothetical protein
MPFSPILAVALGALVGALAARNLVKEWRRAKADVERAKRTSVDDVAGAVIPKLRRDPKTGIYRP